jgi:hypothetical protein
VVHEVETGRVHSEITKPTSSQRAGFVVGPLIAIGLMRLSGDDFHLVFWIADPGLSLDRRAARRGQGIAIQS